MMDDKKMIPYQKQKIDNAICYFAKNYHKKTRKYLCQTTLYKMLSLLDYYSLTEIGQPVLNLQYKAWPKGPVPVEIYDNRKTYSTKLCRTVLKTEAQINFVARTDSKPDLNFFSDYEIELMDKILLFLADSSITAAMASESTHQDIIGWKEIYDRNKDKIYDYKEYFPCIPEKSSSDLTPAEESFAIFDGLKKATS